MLISILNTEIIDPELTSEKVWDTSYDFELVDEINEKQDKEQVLSS